MWQKEAKFTWGVRKGNNSCERALSIIYEGVGVGISAVSWLWDSTAQGQVPLQDLQERRPAAATGRLGDAAASCQTSTQKNCICYGLHETAEVEGNKVKILCYPI